MNDSQHNTPRRTLASYAAIPSRLHSSHEDHQDGEREGCFARFLTMAGLAVFLIVALVSCMVNYGRTPDGSRYLTATTGVDADDFEVTPAGTHIKGLVESKGLQIVADTALKMWNAYLIKEGLIYSLGKYYSHEGKLVDSATTIKLEELRTAKSAQEAASHLKELELMKTAGT